MFLLREGEGVVVKHYFDDTFFCMLGMSIV